MKRNIRKVCVVTGTRAEYGLLYWLMKEIQNDPDMKLQIVATGMHLSPEFGLTYQMIETDGFVIDAKVEMLLSSDSPIGISKSLGLGVIGFADALQGLKPDIIVLLGDRYEILAAAQAALVAKIPVAHISGGEKTEGAIDDAIRHSITKMAHLHFVAAEPYRKRVVQLGEDVKRVFDVGDPGVGNITKLPLLDRCSIESSLGFPLGEINFLVTYHPVTLNNKDQLHGVRELFHALDCFPEAKIIITKPNSDVGSRGIMSMIDEYASQQPGRVFVSTSLGQLRYLSAMKHCDVVVGNSSSGIVEAPVMHIPSVNIGDRQRGRLMADSIINCSEERDKIVEAIKKALSREFQEKLPYVESLYGGGDVFKKISEIIKTVDMQGLIYKSFHDVEFTTS